MKRLKITLLLSLVLALSPSLSPISTCQAQVDLDQLYTFGDSLTDNNAEILSMIFGSDPTIYGADPMEAIFDKAADDDDQLTNFAVLGSRSSDVLAQVQYYVEARAAGAIPAATFFSLQGGANDFLDLENNSANLFLLASAAPGENDAADSIVRDVKRNFLASVKLLQRTDRVPMVLWTVPDVTLTSYAFAVGLSSEQAENVRLHLEEINQVIRKVAQNLDFVVLDTYELLQSLAANPPVIHGVTIEPAPFFGFAWNQFADPIHPTQVANAIVANETIALLNDAFDDNIPFYSEDELAVCGVSLSAYNA